MDENKDNEDNKIEDNGNNKIKQDVKNKIPAAPPCCAGCVRWEKFGKSCYYYWEGKKHCTMWVSGWDETAQQPL